MNKKYPKSYFYIIIVFIVLIVLIILPIKLPYVMKTSGKILSGKEWIITKGDDGRLMTSLINNKIGVNQNFNVSVFERGDAVNFSLRSVIHSGYPISAGDTVASIYSNELESSITQLRGDLLSEKAALVSLSTGEKISIIKEAEHQIQYAETKVEEQGKIVDRNKKLFEADIISVEDYEISQSTLQLYQTNIDIAKQKLATVLTGVKREEIKYTKALILSIEHQIKVLEERASSYNFISPISGVVSRSFSRDTVLVISDTTEFVLMIPVLWEDTDLLEKCNEIEVFVPGKSEVARGVILNISNSVHTIGSNQVRMAIAIIEEGNKNFIPGLMVRCNLKCGEMSPFEFIVNLFGRLLT